MARKNKRPPTRPQLYFIFSSPKGTHTRTASSSSKSINILWSRCGLLSILRCYVRALAGAADDSPQSSAAALSSLDALATLVSLFPNNLSLFGRLFQFQNASTRQNESHYCGKLHFRSYPTESHAPPLHRRRKARHRAPESAPRPAPPSKVASPGRCPTRCPRSAWRPAPRWGCRFPRRRGAGPRLTFPVVAVFFSCALV